MSVCFGILVLYGILFLMASQTSSDSIVRQHLVLIPFYRISLFLWDKLSVFRKRDLLNCAVQKNLETLYCGKKDEVRQFYVDKLALALLVVFIGTGISFGAEAASESEYILKGGNSLERPGYGEGSRQEELKARLEGQKETEKIIVNVGERQYTPEEKKQFIKDAIGKMDQWILGENPSMDEVRDKIHLPESVLNGLVSVEWVQEPYEVLDEEGMVVSEVLPTGTLVKLTGYLDCGGEEGEYIGYVRVMPPVLTAEEELYRKLEKEVKAANEKKADEERLYLPEKVDGKAIEWFEVPSDIGFHICILSLAAGICVYFGPNREIEKKIKYRQYQLRMDYTELLFKLSMLLGAGLTMKGAFEKIAIEYERCRDNKVRYVYEEMLASYHEMQSGVPESVSYENFGRRCQDAKYVKLGSILSQNLKKGAGGLLQILQNEAELSMEERRQMARKLGEEAGTKLLLPMIMMLAVVFAILLVPAVKSF